MNCILLPLNKQVQVLAKLVENVDVLAEVVLVKVVLTNAEVVGPNAGPTSASLTSASLTSASLAERDIKLLINNKY